MSVTLTKSAPVRELVAVIGALGKGVYIHHPKDRFKTIYLREDGVATEENFSLEDAAKAQERTPVYTGEEIIISFK